ncbi:DUF4870 domain-containing protein [Solibacillus daqui]|uniref:DUF4870 domain-containing protein n=1 Tax=Solibacillus daqui TaxID=2912187 RepID=UPI002366BD21|nr:DUF4870 domain-containing protein [Solibacillus daqui]
MNQSKGLSALGYLSFYFAPFILPLIVFFVTKDDFVKHHNKRAFISQLFPIVLGIIYFISFIVFVVTDSNFYGPGNLFEGWIFIGFIILAVISFAIAIWNLVQAIKVLR